MSEIDTSLEYEDYIALWDERVANEPKAHAQLKMQYLDLYMEGHFEELAFLMQDDLPFFCSFFHRNEYGNLEWARHVFQEHTAPFLKYLCELYYQNRQSPLGQFISSGSLDSVFSYQYGYHAVWPHIQNSEYHLLLEISQRMRHIKHGEFLMGALRTDYEADLLEFPRHRVRLDYDFSIGVFPVTRLFFRHIMGYFSDARLFDTEAFLTEGDYPRDKKWPSLTLPISRVSWLEALLFCNKLSESEGLEPVYNLPPAVLESSSYLIARERKEFVQQVSMNQNANGYRLPTEAEWEYAARAGRSQTFSGGYDYESVAWLQENSENRSHPVGQKQSNQWGLFDMSGNVWEWCWEGFESIQVEIERFNRRKGRVTVNPVGAESGLERMSRGGGWSESKDFAYLAFRHREEAIHPAWDQGFRIVRTLSEKNNKD